MTSADLVSGAAETPAQVEMLPHLVGACSNLIATLASAFEPQVADYVVLLIDQLEAAGIPQAPARRMLARSILAVHAAGYVLGTGRSNSRRAPCWR